MVCIRFIVGMTLRTMSPGLMAGAGNRWPDATQVILPGCDRLDMRGVDARVVAAEMVRLKPCRDRADQLFVGDAMSVSAHPVDAEPTIALPVESCRPLPARAEIGPMRRDRAVLVDLRPEARRQTGIAEGGSGKLGLHRELILLVSDRRALTRRGGHSFSAPIITWPKSATHFAATVWKSAVLSAQARAAFESSGHLTSQTSRTAAAHCDTVEPTGSTRPTRPSSMLAKRPTLVVTTGRPLASASRRG